MPIKFPDGNGGVKLIGADISNYFDDEVSLHGGVRVWDRVHLAQNTSLRGDRNYLNFDESTINAGANLHYTGKHVFDDKITLKSGLYTADSMRSDFGDYGSIKATNDTINVTNSTIMGGATGATFTGKIKFADKVTLQSSTEFQDDIKVADSLDVVFGSHGAIAARHDTINVTDSVIKGYHSVTGNVYYEDKQYFEDDIIARGKVQLQSNLSAADSLKHDFGSYTTIAATNDTLDFRNSYIRLSGATLSGGSLAGGGGDYTLPTASSSTKGGIKVGAGLSMSGETLNVVQSNTVILATVPSTIEGAMWYVL